MKRSPTDFPGVKRRRPGLQGKWAYVVNSLQEIVPSYELASSRISLFADKKMREEAVSFAVRDGDLVLDLGSGPGTMSKVVAKREGAPVLLDASRVMLKASGSANAVQGAFEHLPFRDGAFDSGVSGFAVRDAHDLQVALAELGRVLKPGGRFALCDLGKPDSPLNSVALGVYLRVVPPLIGLASAGRAGLRYGSLFDTYNLVLHNSDLAKLLTRYLGATSIHSMSLGGAIVAKCQKRGAPPSPA
ncbi:MAG: class I SAM-dependent methyltransferase [Nitrososphaerota archaeon]|nr:class I SAM-dependent methyltransferase [Nitrososphaerota archaeon]MDG7019447.1 class I SAM-dependent methyltransferase [Nitrososphaerota archaeon]